MLVVSKARVLHGITSGRRKERRNADQIVEELQYLVPMKERKKPIKRHYGKITGEVEGQPGAIHRNQAG